MLSSLRTVERLVGVRTFRNLLITGGWAHPCARTAPRLVEILDATTSSHITTDTVWDLDDASRALAENEYDLITVFACWFTMQDARYNDEQRTTWARAIGPRLRAQLLAHRDAQRPLFALHTAPISFDDWPEWGEWMGGSWYWPASYHPPISEVRLAAADRHCIIAGVEKFNVVDECYSKLAVSPDVTVLYSGETDKHEAPEPLVWIKQVGGRVAYDALGHDVESLNVPAHATMIRRCAAWLLGEPDEVVARIL